MKKSLVQLAEEKYRITITANTEDEKVLLEKPLSEIKEKVNLFFDQAVKEELGENASISSVIDDSGLPYEICVSLAIKKI